MYSENNTLITNITNISIAVFLSATIYLSIDKASGTIAKELEAMRLSSQQIEMIELEDNELLEAPSSKTNQNELLIEDNIDDEVEGIKKSLKDIKSVAWEARGINVRQSKKIDILIVEYCKTHADERICKLGDLR